MQPGDKIGRYLLEKPLGEGAMSVVFVAKHPDLDPRVALKILRREVLADKQYANRFLEDARAAASLNHANIVRVTDFDRADGVPFIVMDLVEGWSLEQRLKESGKLPVPDAARIARDIALGLGAAHASKIVHRDVKPSNVLVDSRTGTAKLTDFGAAKRERSEDLAGLTAHGQAIGTPRYMAPEQVNGDAVDPRTDLWALGATLYEMLAGQPAFSASNLARLYQSILADDPPKLAGLRPDVPPELASLVGRLLSKSRTARPDTADEVAEALLPFTSSRAAPSTATTAGPAATSHKPGPSAIAASSGGGFTRPALIGGGVAAVVAAAGLAFILWPSGPDGPITVTPPEDSEIQVATGTPEPLPATPVEPTPPPSIAEPTPPPEPAPEPTPAPQPEPIPEPQQQAALPPEPTLPAIDEAALDSALAELSCIDATPSVAGDGVVKLAGTAASADLAAQVRRLLEQVQGVQSIEGDLAVQPAPGCLAAARIEQAVGNGAGPTVAMNRPDGIYREGDYLVLDIAMPPDGPDHLFVDLLTDAGAVYHLLPEPLTRNNQVPPGGKITLGVEEADKREGVRHWQVVPPLGPGYLVMTASEKPLYQGIREIEEPIQDYLDVVMPALTDDATGETAVRVERVEFRERS